MHKSPPIACISLLLSLFLSLAVQGGSTMSTNCGIYTKEQAKAGAKLYKEHCLICHDKKYFKPVLKTWEGRTLALLFETMSTTMPETNPASLPRQNYVDILAYILSLSKYPAGDTKLDYRNKSLENTTIKARVKPK